MSKRVYRYFYGFLDKQQRFIYPDGEGGLALDAHRPHQLCV